MNPSTFRAPAVLIVALNLFAETLVLLGFSAFLIYQLVFDSLDSVASAVGLVLITFAAAAWITTTSIGFIQGKSFARGDGRS